MQITKVDGESGRFFLKNNGQITIFDSAKLTAFGNLIIYRDGEPLSGLEEEIVKEATQLMIDNGIVITNEAEKVGV
tara:strand:+ start:479 stop:706 length:228 start_codon:yes stop_codon:yes gene_type:complete